MSSHCVGPTTRRSPRCVRSVDTQWCGSLSLLFLTSSLPDYSPILLLLLVLLPLLPSSSSYVCITCVSHVPLGAPPAPPAPPTPPVSPAPSQTDFMLGKVLAALDASGFANNTVVSIWGDHGWQLGEHGEWCKHTNFEYAARAPMMVHVPGLTDGGIKTEHYSEHVDLFPTLTEAAMGETLPICPKGDASFKVREKRERREREEREGSRHTCSRVCFVSGPTF